MSTPRAALVGGTLLATAAAVVLAAACGGSSAVAATAGGDVPAAFRKFSSDVRVSVEGDWVVLKATSVPDHKSVYFATTDPRYEAYNGTNPRFMRAPGSIVAQNLTFRIPLRPTRAARATATPLGPIGLAVNGVALFNQYNGQSRPLTVEIDTFDQWSGHPTPTNQYHYHTEPTSLTQRNGASALVGFLLDGFPVYGPVENGRRVTNADLDELHGHVGVTADYPAGIYHYHVTDADPYLNGAGFYGAPGTVGR